LLATTPASYIDPPEHPTKPSKKSKADFLYFDFNINSSIDRIIAERVHLTPPPPNASIYFFVFLGGTKLIFISFFESRSLDSKLKYD